MIFLPLDVVGFHILRMSYLPHSIVSPLGDQWWGKSLECTLNKAILISLRVGCCYFALLLEVAKFILLQISPA